MQLLEKFDAQIYFEYENFFKNALYIFARNNYLNKKYVHQSPCVILLAIVTRPSLHQYRIFSHQTIDLPSVFKMLPHKQKSKAV
jgi:hypothetical protein